MSARAAARTLWAVATALTGAGLVLLVASLDARVPDSWGSRGSTATFALSFSTLGVLIVLARRNLVGWLLLRPAHAGLWLRGGGPGA